MTQRTILIQGAGIGGLALARELDRLGWDWRIVERAPQIAPIGAGITLASNALKCLRRTLDIEQLRARGQTLRLMHVHNAKSEHLSSLDTKLPDDLCSGIAIHRHELHAALLEGLDPTRIHLGKSIAKVETGKAICATLTDGTEIEVDFLVGADGIRSGVRAQVFDSKPIVFSGEVAWRAVVPHVLSPDDESVEAWGRGKRLGYIQISPNWVYIYVTIKMSHEAYETGRTKLSRDQLRQRLSEFQGQARIIVEKFCEAPEIIHTDLEELQTHQWVNGRTVLIGDAAHAITPNLGQGAAMAIEDAYTLASIWATDASPEALQRFEQRRKDRLLFVGDESRKVGRYAQWEMGASVALRNFLIAHFPKSQHRQFQEKLFTGVME